MSQPVEVDSPPVNQWELSGDSWVFLVGGRTKAVVWPLGGFVDRPDRWHATLPKESKHASLYSGTGWESKAAAKLEIETLYRTEPW